MGRPRLHTDDAILDAARDLVLTSGLAAATMDAIAVKSGAPSGSLYHRFGSRKSLLQAMWLRAVRRSQEAFCAEAAACDPMETAVSAALSILDFVQASFEDARMLATVRPRDVLSSSGASAMKALNEPIAEAVRRLASALARGRRPSARSVEVVTLAIVDLPFGAVRRHLVAGRLPPADTRVPLEAAVRAALATLLGTRRCSTGAAKDGKVLRGRWAGPSR